MAAAAAAVHLGADHAVGGVGRRLYRAFLRVVEARPAGAAVELPFRHEQGLAAAGAGEGAAPLLVIERAASRRLGAVTAQHYVLLGREQLAPFLVGVRHRVVLGIHGSLHSAGSPVLYGPPEPDFSIARKRRCPARWERSALVS